MLFRSVSQSRYEGYKAADLDTDKITPYELYEEEFEAIKKNGKYYKISFRL